MKDYSDLLGKLNNNKPRGLNDHILVIDAMNMLIRNFASVKSMNPQGSHTGGFLGFLRSLGYMTRMFNPTRVIVVWDGRGGSGNRQNINPEYKAQRANRKITNWGIYDNKEEETEALIGQLFRTQDYLNCLPVHQLQMDKLEADDIIALLAITASSSGKQCTIVSSDRDFLQLVNNNITVYAPIKKETFTYNYTKSKLGVLPENYSILKALLGDKSDNIKGVRGLGVKTVIKLFPALTTNPFVELDYIYDTCEGRLNTGKKVYANIIDQWDVVETNFELMNLHNTVLDDNEKSHILNELIKPIPTLQQGVFLHMLEYDKVEGITKNTESWLGTFKNLEIYK